MPILAMALAVLLIHRPPIANQSNRGELTLDRILSGEFSESNPAPDGEWLPDGKSTLSVDGDSSVYALDMTTGAKKLLIASKGLIPKGARRPLDIERAQFSKNLDQCLIFTNSSKVWRQNTKGDYWLYSVNTNILRKIGDRMPASSLMFAKISPDGTKVGFVYENNLYTQDVKTGQILQLTKDGSNALINGTFDWVYEEELDLRDGWRWSPDSRSIAYWQVNSAMEPLYTLIDDTDSLYPKLKTYPYPKAGEANPTVRIGVVPCEGGVTKWLDRQADSKSGYLARMEWADNSDEILFEEMNRAQNRIEYRIANARTGVSRLVCSDRDAAWVDVLDTEPNGIRWVSGGKRFLIYSERSGWRHVYSVSRDGNDVNDVTPGEFDVSSLEGVDESHGVAYFMASPNNSTQNYLFESDMDKPHPRRVSPSSEPGTHEYRISPNGLYAVNTFSKMGVPPTQEVVRLPDHQVVRELGDNSELKEKLHDLRLGRAGFTHLKADDGEEMDVSVIVPPDIDMAKKYPVFFQVYGEPAGTTVHDAWEGFDYLFAQLLAQRGYIVVSVDNRGTPALKGRAWRKSVYKKIGVLASKDQAAAASQLATLSFVDRNRIGIWGWSGGGSMTLNMMFRYPDIYKVGMAVAPVPDTRLYDSIYQERYMGTPQENPEVYRECSPITYAHNLKGDLLIVHGSGDDNVHFQGTERLVNELVADGKPFQLMVYPNRTHSISEGPGTRHHLYELLVRFLVTNLPPGGK